MNIWNGIGAYPEEARPVVASIGNYDGVHLGHQAILRLVVDDARRRGLPAMLITFDPHPASVLAPERRPRLLQTRRQKLDRLQDTGLTDLLLLEFNEDLAALSGEQFFDGLLSPRLSVATIHVGENFRFGRGRAGDLDLLRRIGLRLGFDVNGVAPVLLDEMLISSSAIRTAIAEGNVELAREMLGRPFSILGEVVRGDGRGHSLQCPTANLEYDNELVPRPGVYVTESVVLASRCPSLTNVGYRPTVGGAALTVETHILDFEEEIYGERLEVRFLAHLRDEVRFDGLSELADQLARDRAAAESYVQHQRLRAQ
jgi:riboflavin kinase/FMN adenylyltransferase